MNRIADRCRVVNLDEAHCISTWGGSFRPDYLELGDLRGLVPSHVPILIASATWPSNVLDEVRQVVGMPPNTRRIAISNARPNVALSVRATAHEEPSFADLRFLIPVDAKKTADIPVTLVYFNERLKAERACDRLSQWARDAGIEIPDGDECVAFYHAKVGPKRKRELEAMLAAGKVRILCCTDAVGMVSFVFCVAIMYLPQSRVVICATSSASFCGSCRRPSARSSNVQGELLET